MSEVDYIKYVVIENDEKFEQYIYITVESFP